MTVPLYLIEPHTAPEWAPFAGVRPISELRAGIWSVRERWEAAVDSATTEILGSNIAHFREGNEPRCRAMHPIDGPAIVGASWFAPTGAPVEIGPDARRLTAGDTTVGWVVPSGERWAGPNEDGQATPIEGIVLRGTFDLLTAMERLLAPDCAGFAALDHDPLPDACIVIGKADLVVSRGARVEPGVVFDTRAGAVVLEPEVEVRNGTRLEGPLYAGDHTRILGGHLRASVFGPRCSVKGEISSSVFLGYSNKSHDGFVGHSAIGCWVNLGAGTTTSNLKNTYGDVSLEIEGRRFTTGRQFLGSLIGDHAKTAIGTMLSTGTVVGAGANLFGPAQPPRYVPPMSWGNHGIERLSEDGFLKVAERVMPRREVAFTPERRASLAATYRKLRGI